MQKGRELKARVIRERMEKARGRVEKARARMVRGRMEKAKVRMAREKVRTERPKARALQRCPSLQAVAAAARGRKEVIGSTTKMRGKMTGTFQGRLALDWATSKEVLRPPADNKTLLWYNRARQGRHQNPLASPRLPTTNRGRANWVFLTYIIVGIHVAGRFWGEGAAGQRFLDVGFLIFTRSCRRRFIFYIM